MKLQVKDHPQTYIVLSTKTYTLGRDKANDLVLEAPGISDFHAEVICESDEIVIVDLLSASGTFVNAARISGKHQLTAWDVVRLGEVQLELNDPSVPKPSPWQVDIRYPDGSSVVKGIEGVTVLGRDGDCDVVLEHELISRRHLELTVASNHIELKDLNSANGTILNGRPVGQGVAYAGDEILLDPFRLTLVGADQAQAEAAAVQDRTQLKIMDDGDTSVFEDASHTEIVGESYRIGYLVDISDVSNEQRYTLLDNEYTLGRHSRCDIVLADSSISKKHALLSVQTGNWYVQDLDSSNGVLVNGMMVRKAQLSQGDRIRLGRAELIFGFETKSRR